MVCAMLSSLCSTAVLWAWASTCGKPSHPQCVDRHPVDLHSPDCVPARLISVPYHRVPQARRAIKPTTLSCRAAPTLVGNPFMPSIRHDVLSSVARPNCTVFRPCVCVRQAAHGVVGRPQVIAMCRPRLFRMQAFHASLPFAVGSPIVCSSQHP